MNQYPATPATPAIPAIARRGAHRLAAAGAALAALLATAGLFAGPAFAADTDAGVSVQLCPAVRPVSYPAGDGARFTTLALPRIAVVNGRQSGVNILEVRAELMRNGRVMAAHELDEAAVGGVAAPQAGQAVDACRASTSDRAADLGAFGQIGRNQAVVLSGTVFGWTGDRDAVRIVVRSRRGAEDHREAAVFPLAPPVAAPPGA